MSKKRDYDGLKINFVLFIYNGVLCSFWRGLSVSQRLSYSLKGGSLSLVSRVIQCPTVIILQLLCNVLSVEKVEINELKEPLENRFLTQAFLQIGERWRSSRDHHRKIKENLWFSNYDNERFDRWTHGIKLCGTSQNYKYNYYSVSMNHFKILFPSERWRSSMKNV